MTELIVDSHDLNEDPVYAHACDSVTRQWDKVEESSSDIMIPIYSHCCGPAAEPKRVNVSDF